MMEYQKSMFALLLNFINPKMMITNALVLEKNGNNIP